jgi:acetoin:2,6-dichlorophenolindophenol oxidoreductase subunit alpha
VQLDRPRLLEAYRLMTTIRAFEERVSVEFARGKIPGFVHLYAGQEASAVGLCMHLSDADFIGSTHRGHGHCIAKGSDVGSMMLELFGKEGGICCGKGGSMHLADFDKGIMGANSIVGAAVPLALGAALAAKTKKTADIAVAFCGDGGANQGGVLESLNLASVWNLPVVFAFEDNGYAETTASSWAVAGGPIVNRAAAFGMPGERVDGFDFFGVYEAGGRAVERARAGSGPTLLHIETGRFFGHHEGDSQTYRAPGEVAELRRDRDCLKLFRSRITQAGLIEANVLDAIDDRVRALIESAVRAAEVAPLPSPHTVHENVYVSY